MPLDSPVTTPSGTSWDLSARYGNVEAVTIRVSIIVESSATEADGDQALQEVVDALSARQRINGVYGQKTYTVAESRAMQPTT